MSFYPGPTSTDILIEYIFYLGHKESSGQLMDKISGSIQSSIPCIATFSCGLIAPLPSLKLCNSLELEKPKLPCFSYLSVPKVPGLQAKTFVVTKTQGFALQKNVRFIKLLYSFNYLCDIN